MSASTVEATPSAPLKRLRKDELIRLLEQEQSTLANERKARQLALHLIQQLGLFPNGIDLVCWLDSPGARSNQVALENWVGVQLACPDLSTPTEN